MSKETSLPTLTGNVLTITFRIHPDPLPARHCIRCEGKNFRAIVGRRIKHQALCDLMMEEDHVTGCGRIINGTLKCGDWIESTQYWDEISPSSIPLVVCLDCGRLASLV